MAIFPKYVCISISIPSRYIFSIVFKLSGHKARPLARCGGRGGELKPRRLVLPLQSIDGVHPAGPKVSLGSSGPKKRKEKSDIRKTKTQTPKKKHKG
jgi:hypothetical protein